MLVQNQDQLVLATSGSHSQSKTSPLLDELISVPREVHFPVRQLLALVTNMLLGHPDAPDGLFAVLFAEFD
jgi:hypothetical protein